MHKLKRLYLGLTSPYWYFLGGVIWLLAVMVMFSSPVYAVIRFTERSLFVLDTSPSATTTYRVSLTYTTVAPVGSIEMLFCVSPIPGETCIAPPGLDVSQAVLSDQTGETGYSITQRSTNRLVLSRSPNLVGNTPSTYTLDNVVNPSSTAQSFAIRLSDYGSTDASGPSLDIGSVLSSVNSSIRIETQVPPWLSFCVGKQVSQDCTDISGGNYTDMGSLSTNHALTATSQMAAGTNASGGYAITAYGTTMTAGSDEITALKQPTLSAPGNSQFGINLRANTEPRVGDDPDGAFANANPTANYAQANKYMFHDGDVVASAPNVSLVRRFTVSYIVNVPANLKAGVYTTTLTYVCTGKF